MQPRLSKPRIPPISDAEMTEEQRRLGGDRPASMLNVLRTLLRYPTLFKAWEPLAGHIMSSALSPREKGVETLDEIARQARYNLLYQVLPSCGPQKRTLLRHRATNWTKGWRWQRPVGLAAQVVRRPSQ